MSATIEELGLIIVWKEWKRLAGVICTSMSYYPQYRVIVTEIHKSLQM